MSSGHPRPLPAASFIPYLPGARSDLICELSFEEQNGFLLPSNLLGEIQFFRASKLLGVSSDFGQASGSVAVGWDQGE